MTAEHSQYNFIIARSKFLLLFSCLIIAVVSFQLSLMSILLGYKMVAILVAGLFGALFVRRFQAATADHLIYKPGVIQWILNGSLVRLQSNQFVTRNLIIIYFIANNGKKITQLVPADTMPRQQHISLRRLLIGCCQSR
jgi:hypothetical protein